MPSSSRSSRPVLAALASVAACLAAAPAAFGAHAGGSDAAAYHAEFVRSSPTAVSLESGQVATSWFEARNLSSTITWQRPTAKLGTTTPYERASALFWPDDWLSATRATGLDQAAVGAGAVGRFTFRVKAPVVNTPTTYREVLGPLVEGAAWMDQAEWGTRFIDYTVTPPSPPIVSLVNTPVRVRRGETVGIAASVRDDYKVGTVQFSLGTATVDGTVPNPEAPDTYFAALNTNDLPSGLQTVTVKATDHVGNARTVTHQLEVFDPLPAPVAPSVNASVQLRARVLSRRRGVRVLGLTVRAPVGSRIEVTCVKRGCRKQVVDVTRRSVTRPGRTKNRVLRRGTKLYVRVTKPGMTGELNRFTVGRRSVSRTEYAVPAGQ